MKAKVGMYFYSRRREGYQIYQYDSVESNGTSANPISGEYYFDREEARKRVYELNGWKYNERA